MGRARRNALGWCCRLGGCTECPGGVDEHDHAADLGATAPETPTPPVEIDRLEQVNWLLITLVVLLATLALVAVAHALITGVSRRRRDLAPLKTLGFNRRQLRSTIAWQATTLGTVGLVIGIPLGIVAGNVVWRIVSDGLGISTRTWIPALAVLLTIPAVLALVNVIAYLPARTAARTRPAVALRAE